MAFVKPWLIKPPLSSQGASSLLLPGLLVLHSFSGQSSECGLQAAYTPVRCSRRRVVDSFYTLHRLLPSASALARRSSPVTISISVLAFAFTSPNVPSFMTAPSLASIPAPHVLYPFPRPSAPSVSSIRDRLLVATSRSRSQVRAL